MDTEKFFDNRRRCILDNFEIHNKAVYIWGAGVLGRELQIILEHFSCLKAFIDNDINKQKNGCEGKSVISFDEYLKQGNGIVVIAVSEKNMETIKEQLEQQNMVENKDFFVAEFFMNYILPVLSFYLYDNLFIPLTQVSLTERCSLKCKYCAHGCNHVGSDSEDLEVGGVKKLVDTFFNKVDFVGEFVLIGGEPFLYKDLKEVIEYIGQNYRKKIGIFSITTNGTILPKEDVLEVCKKHQTMLRISNYSNTITRLKEKYEILCERLETENVQYVLGDTETHWIDYGFGTFQRAEDENLVRVFRQCMTPCRELRDNKFYFCVMARSVSQNLHIPVGEEDYLDLNMIHEENKEEMLKYHLGYFKKGYLDMCRYCRGAEATNYIIPAAEQG